MSAPAPGSAKVTVASGVVPLGTTPTPDEVITADDAKDPAKLAQILGRLLKTVADLRRQWSPRNLDYEDIVAGISGAKTLLQHDLAGRTRWWVTGWKTTATPTTDIGLGSRLLWIQRALWGGLTLVSVAVNVTGGCRFQATSPTSVMGVRFLWKSAARTVKATLWRDSDGAILGQGTVAVSNTGIYTVLFASPVTIAGADLNVDLTVGFWDTAGTATSNTGADAVFSGYLPLQLPGLLLKAINLDSAGDVRPTGAVAGLFWAEPIITPASPTLVEDPSSTNDRLVLASYVPGLVTIRGEESG